jgi:DNA-directed RNA polymerase specialized sigma24 family protein
MLEILSKNHNIWVAMGLSIGIPQDIVEDFVHETYLRLNKYIDNPEKIMYNETEINKFYVYVTLKNLWSDYSKAKSKYKVYRIDDSDYEYIFDTPEWALYEEVDYEKERAEEYILTKITQEVDSWDHWYDKKLFKLYYNTDISMRKLAKETRISVTSIFNSCKNYKDIIKTKFGEDFEDYLNGDFDKIKKL